VIYLGKKNNILKHNLVPEHTILSPSDKEKLLKKYNISDAQLPAISVKDPIVKVLQAKPGDVLKINRNGPSGEYLYFRKVVE